MKIALIGYGKMGKTIEQIAIDRGHEIVLKINIDNTEEMYEQNLQQADVAIEFTSPASAVENIRKCTAAKVPIVCGSTGWLDQWNNIAQEVIDQEGALLYASNFSIGMNIFFEINRQLASLMNTRKEYDVSMEEIHHTEKKDAPSGTAITLANDMINLLDRKNGWVLGEHEDASKINILSKRIDPAPGTHIITYDSEIDQIQMTHTAHNRKGFALGAVLAAEYLKGKKGIHEMRNVLGLPTSS